MHSQLTARHLQLSWPFVAAFAILILLAAGYFIAQKQLRNRLPLGFEVARASYSLTPAAAAAADLHARVERYLAAPLPLQIGNLKVAITPANLGVTIAASQTLAAAHGELLHFGAVDLVAAVDLAKLHAGVIAKLPQVELLASDATARLQNGTLQISPEKMGRAVPWGVLASTLIARAAELSDETVRVPLLPRAPTVRAADLATHADVLLNLLASPIAFNDTPYRRFEINFADRLNWFDFTAPGPYFQKLDHQKPSQLKLNAAKVREFVAHELAPAVESSPAGVTISRNLKGGVTFDGVARTGRTVDVSALIAALQTALAHNEKTVQIPFRTLPAPVVVGPELQKLGIRQLIGTSETNYQGSAPARLKNIAAAAAKINGLLLAPGAEFSFVNAISPITLENGYTEGLVIKEGEIEPEVGGGVCQVSTTIFRSVLDAGLAVTQQRAHSLKISYYDPPGLDATIYPGSVDFKFKNDTSSQILLQTHIEGARLRVNIFGTSDGRRAAVTGPFYPDGTPVMDLHKAGLRLRWQRVLQAADGTQKKEEYRANYRSVH